MKMREKTSTPPACCLLAGAAALILGGAQARPSGAPGAHHAREAALLLAQAQFVTEATPGKEPRAIPGPGKLVFLYPDDAGWTSEVLEDADSNVLHKAMPFDVPGERPGILTIGANKAPLPAMLKVWRRTRDGWKGSILWEGRFGGRFNRFRDVEIGDVTGDGKPEIVLATHDQGAVIVLQKEGDTWKPTEIDRSTTANIVHEIEIGDVDGDGRNEILATPSARNRRSGRFQPGRVALYRYDGRRFSSHTVEAFGDHHAKEILVADLGEPGPPDIYALVEVPVLRHTGSKGAHREVELKQYRFTGTTPATRVVATLPDTWCRFLNAGDVDGDGRTELVASAFKSGVWMIKPSGEEWGTRLIDGDSGGYVHPSALADLDRDGKLEIYVATDDQQQVRQYRWTGDNFERTDVFKLTKGDITWGLMPCVNARCLAVQPAAE